MHSSSCLSFPILDDGINYSHTLEGDHTRYHDHKLKFNALEEKDVREDRAAVKRLKNRIASRKCREKKELKIQILQSRLQQLIVENQVLKEMLSKEIL